MQLLEGLRRNALVKHFLLGNNIIGPAGARAIADFATEFPNKIETWYLAGNCIDNLSFRVLAKSWLHSSSITNIWLKRNPLGTGSIDLICEPVRHLPQLRTLDLDMTELGDDGVADFFVQLREMNSKISLKNLYLNATGISTSACAAIASYLATPNSRLESLYMANNPIGDGGLELLSAALGVNTSLVRLFIPSCGLKNKGTTILLNALTRHANLASLDIGQSYATTDLGMRYNYLSDEPALEQALQRFIIATPQLRLLNLGTCALSHAALSTIAAAAVLCSSSILSYTARTCVLPPNRKDIKYSNDLGEYRRMQDTVRKHLLRNIRSEYGSETTQEDFDREHLRWLKSPKDVRYIDSVYRNRDASLARRKLMVLRKRWDEGDRTLERVKDFV